jgi:hypothetical protein
LSLRIDKPKVPYSSGLVRSDLIICVNLSIEWMEIVPMTLYRQRTSIETGILRLTSQRTKI